MKYDATPVTTTAIAASTAIVVMKPVSGPPGAFSPRSRVCCTATGITIRPRVASTAKTSVPL
jgi:hypothetical protein